jgi:hypothetical protein
VLQKFYYYIPNVLQIKSNQNINTLIQIFKSVTKALFTPGPTTLWAPFGGLPGWRRTSWMPSATCLRTRYPTVIFNRGCGAYTSGQNLRTFFKKVYIQRNKHDGYLID